MYKQKNIPPKLAGWLLKRLLTKQNRDSIIGDFEEIYSILLKEKGKLRAKAWYWKQTLTSFPSFLINTFEWGATMFKHLFKTTIRNIRRQRLYSFINIIGLAIGLTCAQIIMLWVFDELSYDRFHNDYEQIYRLGQDDYYSGQAYRIGVTPYLLAPTLKEELPEVEDYTRFVYTPSMLLKHEDKLFFEEGLRAVDPSFLNMFNYPLLAGDKSTALSAPYSIIVTEEMALKYFGSLDVLGQSIVINGKYSFNITGIMENLPVNTSIEFDFLVPLEATKIFGYYREDWDFNSILTYLKVSKYISQNLLEEKTTEIYRSHLVETIGDEKELDRFNSGPKRKIVAEPIAAVHLYHYSGFGNSSTAITDVYIFVLVAFFVLLIACINFMNLSTAKSAGRAKEVGLRKTLGAFKSHLVSQFFGESLFMVVIAQIFSLILTILILPEFNLITSKEFQISDLYQFDFIAGLIGITLITGLLSGSYPALFLSSFQSAEVLKGRLSTGSRSGIFRKILVVTQFTLSIALIIGTIVVFKQTNFMQSQELGYNKSNLIYMPLSGNARNSYEYLKQRLLSEPGILNVSGSISAPTYFAVNSGDADWEGRDPQSSFLVSSNGVDFNYIETMGLEIAEGRSFSKAFPTDSAEAFIINQKLAKIIDDESVIGKRFSFQNIDGKIIGVIKDFHFQSLREEIEPLAINFSNNSRQHILVRLAPGNISGGINTIQSVWKSIVPNYPFEYYFADEAISEMYKAEQRIGAMLQIFTFLIIFIASLGLFGLASYMAEQRTKEIGVRKTLGASVPNIVLLLSKEFTKWVLIANIIAWPIAYYFLGDWLESFAYRISLSVWFFIFSGIAAIGVALLTVSFQAIKAARMNPVDSLKYE